MYHYNANQDWSNINCWGSPFFPMDAGQGVVIGGLHNFFPEQSLTLNMEQPTQAAPDHTFGSVKGKEIMQEELEKKGKKATGRGRGKAKLIPTSHKTSPKSSQQKRGGVSTKGEQVGGKKPKMSRVEEQDGVKQNLQEEEAAGAAKSKECNNSGMPIVITEIEETNEAIKAGLDVSQPCQEK